MSFTRRRFLVSAGAYGAAAANGVAAEGDDLRVTLPIDNGVRPVAAFPQKRALIVQSTRPPVLETPFRFFDLGEFTPNDAFYVRWHLAGVPTSVDLSTFRLSVHGAVAAPLSLRVDDLREQFEAIEIPAVNQCSGNSRGTFAPRVPGGQWYNGAMGNARWKGARLRDVLARAHLAPSVKQIRFNGLDAPVLSTTPDFIKALDLAVAADPTVLVAYEMNGEPLPMLNGFPLRLVVPGYFATYWVKALTDIEAIETVDDNFWMKTAYRIPDTPGNSVTPEQSGYPTVPIGKLRVRSFITNVAARDTVAAVPMIVRGIAFDGGSGVRTVEFSVDGGATWTNAALGEDFGPFSFRRWTAPFAPVAGRAYTLACRATANTGDVQAATPGWNPAGYLRNAIETYEVTAV